MVALTRKICRHALKVEGAAEGSYMILAVAKRRRARAAASLCSHVKDRKIRVRGVGKRGVDRLVQDDDPRHGHR